MNQHNHQLPAHNHQLPIYNNCSYQSTGAGESHTHSVQPYFGDPKDILLFMLYSTSQVFLVDRPVDHYRSEMPLTIEQAVERVTEMLSKMIVGVDIPLFVEGIKQELISVINLKLKELRLLEEE